VLIPKYNEQQYQKTSAVIAAQDIPEGTQITAAMVQNAEVFLQSIPSDTAAKADDVVGKYASRYISMADYVTASKLSDKQVSEQEMSVTGSKMIVSVTIPSPAAGISGALKPGDLVSVYAVPKQTAGSGASIVSSIIQTPPSATAASMSSTAPSAASGIPDNAILPEELKYVEVAGIYIGSQTGDKTNAAAIPATVSFYVDEEQAKKLVEIDSGATLHLVLVARGDARLQFLKKEDLQLWS
jgi:pilus assembly protein CpaB